MAKGNRVIATLFPLCRPMPEKLAGLGPCMLLQHGRHLTAGRSRWQGQHPTDWE
ncbi:MAG: hypothetical protein Ct9H300mP32_4630 [Verrucomicrobiota bacterium]|nr:MAG: hypothetical protein Ct9H300mP32_4630 [Verrucomicrobiota bacterium]